jgi:phosphomannomutase
MTGHNFDPTILREYDIRGLFEDNLSVKDAQALGQTLGSLIMEQDGRSVCVGYDGRLSSQALEAALVEGLRGCGLCVLRVGLCPTPMLYFAAKALLADAGVMITGSHNPPQYNGFKIMLNGGPFWGKEILALGERSSRGEWISGDGRVVEMALLEAYITRMLVDFREGKSLKVAWDAGNGSAGEAMTMLTSRLPGQHFLLNAEIDGTFPAHHPDPTVEANLSQLKDCVRENGCDLGIGFDGDGDRIGVIDGDGRVLWGDQLLSIYAADVLKTHAGATVIADVKASQALFDEIARHGGKPVMAPTGHSIIKSKMAEAKAPLAGEMSGHIFFADHYYGFDDALYAAIRLLDILASSDQTLAQIRDALPQVVNTPEIRFDVSEARKFVVVTEVKERLSKTDANIDSTDGVRVLNADGWWLLRASNTQNVLVVRCESESAEGLERLKVAVGEQLLASQVAVPEF